jgi:hypothetical protein
MMDDPLEGLLALAERTYVRMEAKELLAQCLDEGDATPFGQMLEGLVLAGAQSLLFLREILEEIRSTKSSLSSAGMGVRQDVIDAFAQFGIRMPELLTADWAVVFRKICGKGFKREIRRAASTLPPEDEALLEEICIEAGNKVGEIAQRLIVLGRIEETVEDWFTGLAYQSVREQKTRLDSGGSLSSH